MANISMTAAEVADKLYNMELDDSVVIHHDAQTDSTIRVHRVPGGWNYIYMSVFKQSFVQSIVFVPFNNEFMPRS